MKTKYYLIFLGFVLLCNFNNKVSAQNCIVLGYDASGNRISKTLTNNCDGSRGNVETQENIIEEEGISVYPNPTDGVFTIVVPGLNADKTPFYMLYDVNGVLLQKDEVRGRETEVDVGNLASGVYFLRIVNDEDVVSKVILKQ